MNEYQAALVVERLKELKSADKKGKKALLRQYIDSDPIFVKVLKYTLDTSKTYKVSRVAETEPLEGDVFEYLDELAAMPGVKAKDKTYLAGLANQSEYHLDIVNRMLRGRLDAGFDIKTVLEVEPGLVPYSPYCRCSGYEKIDKIDFSKGAFSQLKADGMYLNVFVEENGNIRYTTRNGNELNLLEQPDRFFVNMPLGGVLMGEGLVLDEAGSEFLPRAQGNAIISKAIHGHISKEEAGRIRFQLWDTVRIKEFEVGFCNIAYADRYQFLEFAIKINPDAPSLIETRIVHSKEEAWDHYAEVRAKGLEGTIVKDAGALWEDGTSSQQIKLKAQKNAEVLITGWNKGDQGGKYENCIGSLIAQSSCGKLVGSVSGLTDEQRFRDPESWLGRIITVTFNAVSKSAKTEIRSFDHARIDGDIRTDKHQADDLEYILNVKEAKR